MQESSEAIANTSRAVIITGLSGSGKSTAMRALEDAGYFCIDNLPVPLLPKVFELAAHRIEGRATQPYAFAVDVRERDFLAETRAVIEQLMAEGVNVQVLYLEATDDELVRRYSETRRVHPMSEGGTVREGIAREREALADLRTLANICIDTTVHTVHTLKALTQDLFASESEAALRVTLLSFGFKYGLPTECDLVFDVRFLSNPYFVESLREKTGLDDEVYDYVMSLPDAAKFYALFQQMAEFMLPLYEREEKSYRTIGIGCTGGKHRSVSLVRAISSWMRGRGWVVSTRHRDRERKSKS